LRSRVQKEKPPSAKIATKLKSPKARLHDRKY